MLYQLSHVRVACRTLTDARGASNQGGPTRAAEVWAPDRSRRSAARRVRPAVGQQHVQLVVEVEQRALGTGGHEVLRLPEERGHRRPRELEERFAGRGAQVQEEDVGGGVRGPQPHVTVTGGAL